MNNDDQNNRLAVSNVVRRGNMLQVQFKLNDSINSLMSHQLNISANQPVAVPIISDVIKLANSGNLVFQIKVYLSSGINNQSSIFVKFIYRREGKLFHIIRFTSTELSVTGRVFTCDDNWHQISAPLNRAIPQVFNVTVTYEVLVNNRSFSLLYDDETWTDFELSGQDGAVRFHRTVLSTASRAFRRVIARDWREGASGRVEVQNTSAITLRHLKMYVYLGQLPDSGLEQLLLLACCYVMPDLEQNCVGKLVQNVTHAKAYELLEFAIMNKMTRLVLAILEVVQSSVLDVDEIRDHVRPLMTNSDVESDSESL